MEKQSNMKRLFAYAGKYKYLTIASWIFSALSALTALLPFIYIWKIIKEALDVAPDFSAAQNIAHNGWMAVLFAVVSLMIYVVALLCSHIAAFRVQANIRSQAMHHIVKLPMGFMDETGSGKIRKAVDECGEKTETYLAHNLPDKAGAIATPIGLLVLLLAFDWRLGLLSLVPVVVGFAIMMTMTGKKMAKKMEEYNNALGQMSNEAVEYVRGIAVVKTFGQSVFSFKRFKQSIDNYQKWVISYTKDLMLPMMFYTTIINAVFAVLIAAALFMTSAQVTNEFMLNLLYYVIITPVITLMLTKIMYSSENNLIVGDALKRIDEIMDLQPQAQPEQAQLPQGNSVDIESVTFRYPNSDKKALDCITLHIEEGERIALVGPSGGGKTTLAGMIARFWDVSKGSVKIGGVDVRNISKEQLMNTVAFVFQDSRLLKASVLDNVLMGKPSASRREVEKALHDAQCDDIIKKLPDGIDTVIGENGVYLSGGEQQRIAIARVMLKDAPVLILDEATAYADPDNETKVQAALGKMSQGKTVIMIAHRLSTVVDADRIFVIKDGKVEENGKHKDLCDKQGLYADMWAQYGKAADWKVGDKND